MARTKRKLERSSSNNGSSRASKTKVTKTPEPPAMDPEPKPRRKASITEDSAAKEKESTAAAAAAAAATAAAAAEEGPVEGMDEADDRPAFGRSLSNKHSSRHHSDRVFSHVLEEAHLDHSNLPVMSEKVWDVRYGVDEIVAVYTDEEECKFWIAKLAEDVLRGYGEEVEVEIQWYELPEGGNETSEYLPSESYENVTTGSIICAISDLMVENVDTGGIVVPVAARTLISTKLAAQLADGYDWTVDAQEESEYFAKRVSKMLRQEKRKLRKRAGKAVRMDDDEDDDDGTTKKGKRKKRKPTAPKKKKKRGLVPLPDIKIVPDPMTVKTGKFDKFAGDTERASKEVIRAVVSKDKKVLQAVLKEETAILSLDVPRSVDVQKSALTYALDQGDVDTIKVLLEDIKAQKARGKPYEVTIQTQNSGKHTHQYAHYNRRAVAASRGGKEGNSAFTRSLEGNTYVKSTFTYYNVTDQIVDYLVRPGASDKSIEILEKLEKIDPNIRNTLQQKVDKIVLSGNHKLAHKLLSPMLELGCGMNKYHISALGEEFSNDSILSRSVVKKTDSMYSVRLCPTHCAAINPDTRHLEHLLTMSAVAVSVKDSQTASLLHYAALCRNARPLAFLLKNHGGMLLRNQPMEKTPELPIHWAIRAGRAECVRMLCCDEEVSKKYDFEENMEAVETAKPLLKSLLRGYAALHFAVLADVDEQACLDTVAALLDAGADPNQTANPDKEKVTPVHLACMHGKLEVLKLLVSRGGNIAKEDKKERSTVTLAARNGHAHVVSYLLKEGVDPDAEDSSGNTALHYAVAYGWLKCLFLLIDGAKAQVNVVNQWKTSPISLSLQMGRMACASALLEGGRVDVNFTDDEGRSLFQVVLGTFLSKLNSSPETEEITEKDLPWTIQTVLNNPDLKIDLPDIKGNTPLHTIARFAFNEDKKARGFSLFKLIQQKGCDIAAVTRDGCTVLQAAMSVWNMELAAYLIENGNDVSSCTSKENQTLLHSLFDRLCLSPTPNGLELASVKSLYELLEKKQPDALAALSHEFNANGRLPLHTLAEKIVASSAGVSLPAQSAALSDIIDFFFAYLAKFSSLACIAIERNPLFRSGDGFVTGVSEKFEQAWKTQLRSFAINSEWPSQGGYNLVHIFCQIKRPSIALKCLEGLADQIDGQMSTLVDARDPLQNISPFDLFWENAACTNEPSEFVSVTAVVRFLKNADGDINAPRTQLLCTEGELKNKVEEEIAKRQKEKEQPTTTAKGTEPETCPFVELYSSYLEKKMSADEMMGKISALATEKRQEKLLSEAVSTCIRFKEQCKKPSQQTVQIATSCFVLPANNLVKQGVCRPDVFEGLIAEGLDPTAVDIYDQSALFLAVVNRHQLVKPILESLKRLKPASRRRVLDLVPAGGQPMLHIAVTSKSKELVELLVNAGAAVDLIGHHGRTALHISYHNHYTDISNFLLENKAPVDVADDTGKRVIHLASEYISADITATEELKALLKYGADVNAVDGVGRSSLHWAVIAKARFRKDVLVEHDLLLLEAGANVNVFDKFHRTPLHYCFDLADIDIHLFPHVPQGKYDPIEDVNKLCLVSGIKMDERDEFGRTPLHYASFRSATACALYLQKHGHANIDAEDSDGNPPLAISILCGHSDFSIMLLNQGATPTSMVHDIKRELVHHPETHEPSYMIITHQEHSTIYHAISNQWHGVTFFLLDNGFDNTKAVRDAISCGAFQMVRKLIHRIGKGVKNIVDEQGYTLLHCVADAHSFPDDAWSEELTRQLFDLGVNIKSKGINGQSVLHRAAIHGHVHLSKLLVEQFNLSVDAKDKEGRDAFTCMMQAGVYNIPLYEFFLSHLASPKDVLNGLFATVREEKEITRLQAKNVIAKFSEECNPHDTSVAKLTDKLVKEYKEKEAMKKKPRKASKPIKQPTIDVKSTMLIEAIRKKDSSMVTRLLVDNADPDATDDVGITPLIHAIMGSQTDIVLKLLHFGANPNATDNVKGLNGTPLYHATIHGEDACSEVLLRFSADPLLPTSSGLTPVHVALFKQDKETANKYLRAMTFESKFDNRITKPSWAKKFQLNLARIGGEAAWRVVRIIKMEKNMATVLLASEGDLQSKTPYQLPATPKNVLRLSEYIVPWSHMRALPQDYLATKSLLELTADALTAQARKTTTTTAGAQTTASNLPKYIGNEKAVVDAKIVTDLPEPALWKAAATDVISLGDEVEFVYGGLEAIMRKGGAAPQSSGFGRGFGYRFRQQQQQQPPPPSGRTIACGDGVLSTPGIVVNAHKNGSYDVQLIGGTLETNVRRSLLRLRIDSPESLEARSEQSVLADIQSKKISDPRNGRTLLHDAIAPNWGAFDDSPVAALLVKFGANLNAKDKDGVTPMDLVASGSMLAKLFSKPDQTSDHEENDAEMKDDGGVEIITPDTVTKDFIAAMNKADEDASAKSYVEPPDVSDMCQLSSAEIKVLSGVDPEGHTFYYDVCLTKVDVKHGKYGENNFYKMQVVEDPVKNNFVLVTNWGRIGEYGKCQNTPSTKAGTVKEFEKIFRSKTGNKWNERHNFEKKPKKYVLLKPLRSKFREETDPLKDFPEDLPPSTLSKALQGTIQEFIDVEVLLEAAELSRMDLTRMPLGRLRFSTLQAAYDHLLKVQEALKVVEKEQRSPTGTIEDYRSALQVVATLTNEFYQIFPTSETSNEPIAPFTTAKANTLIETLRDLMEVHLATRLRIAAMENISKKVNPFDYCFRALSYNVDITRMEDPYCPERQFIEQYFANTGGPSSGAVVNEVYKLHRPEDVRRMKSKGYDKMGNHRLLWHGSPASNMVGLLTQGLRIAPPEAPASGYAFGKGVYFADQFQKSYGYCRTSLSEINHVRPRAFLLLCEVVLGTQYRTVQAEYLEKAKNGSNSTLAVGKEGPSNVLYVDEFGTVQVPLGSNKPSDTAASSRLWGGFPYNIEEQAEKCKKIEDVLADPETKYPYTLKLNEKEEVILSSPFATTAELKVTTGSGAANASGASAALALGPLGSRSADKNQDDPLDDIDGCFDEEEDENDEEIPASQEDDPASQDDGPSEPVITVTDYTITRQAPQQGFLNYNEYIVYDEAQVRLKYLVEVTGSSWVKSKFDPKQKSFPKEKLFSSST